MARILILTYGTRGDVEPFVALALGLKRAGHKVSLATAAQFGDWVQGFDFEFVPLSDAALELIHSDDGKAVIEGGAGLFAKIAAGVRMSRKAMPINEALFRETWGVAQEADPDLIVYHPKMIAAGHIAEKLSVPTVMAMLQPIIVPTSAFPATGLPRLSLPGYKRLSYRMVSLAYRALQKPVNRFRNDTLGLPPLRRSRDVLTPPAARLARILHAISPHVMPEPSDWPENAVMCGYWPLPEPQSFTPPDELVRFLDAGPPPVYVGFGSMVANDPDALGQLVVEALRLSGQRGVIGAGWAGLATKAENVLAVHDIPHRWLFPRMAAVVHHGGAGTTAAGFRAGVPSVICPFFADQPGWAAVAREIGVGATPVPRRRLTAERLAASIREAVTNETLRTNARNLATALAAEDGVARAVAEIEASLAA